MTDADAERHKYPSPEPGDASYAQAPRGQKQPGQDLDPTSKPRAEPAPGEPEPGQDLGKDIRPAGPQDMAVKPKDWSKTDEELDESFPASDPPGNY